MKRLFTLLIATTLAFSVWAQQNTPVMSFKATTHEFGNIKQEDGPAKYTFEFTNTGSTPVVITKVESSCGCTTPSYSKQPVPPGGKGNIDVVYDPVNRPGQFNKTITITSNASNSPIVLSINGNVAEKQNSFEDKYPQQIGDLRINNTFINFGNIFNNETKTQTVGIYNPTKNDMTIEIDNNYSSPFILTKITPTVLKANQEGQLAITFDGQKVNDWDFVRASIFLKINGQSITSKPIQLSAIVKEYFTPDQIKNASSISFDQTTYSFDTIKEGEIVEHVFKFTNNGKSDLIIRKTTSSCGCTAASLSSEPVPPGKSGEIKVTFNSAHKTNDQVKTVTVITNSPDPNNKVMIRISGFVIPSGNQN